MRLIFIILLAALSLPVMAENERGAFVGVGAFGASNSDCSGCGYTGGFAEVGFDLNELVGVELKYGIGKSDDEASKGRDLKITFAGVNIGHDLNTDWIRVYGKVGFAYIDEEKSPTSSKPFREIRPTLGAGSRFSFTNKEIGPFAKFEIMGVEFNSGTSGVAFIVGLGYRL